MNAIKFFNRTLGHGNTKVVSVQGESFIMFRLLPMLPLYVSWWTLCDDLVHADSDFDSYCPLCGTVTVMTDFLGLGGYCWGCNGPVLAPDLKPGEFIPDWPLIVYRARIELGYSRAYAGRKYQLLTDTVKSYERVHWNLDTGLSTHRVSRSYREAICQAHQDRARQCGPKPGPLAITRKVAKWISAAEQAVEDVHDRFGNDRLLHNEAAKDYRCFQKKLDFTKIEYRNFW